MKKMNQEVQKEIIGGYTHNSQGGWHHIIFSSANYIQQAWMGTGIHNWYGPYSKVSGYTYKALPTQWCECPINIW